MGKAFLDTIPSDEERAAAARARPLSEMERQELEQITQHAVNCSNCAQISRKTGIPQHRVYTLVTKHKIKLCDKNELLIARIREEVALDPYRSLSDIAQTLDLPYMQVYKLIKRHNIELLVEGKRTQLAEQIKLMAAKGYTQGQMARALGISRQRVHGLVKEFGVAVTLFDAKAERGPDANKYRRCRNLFNQGLNKYQVRLITHLSPTTIIHYFKRWEAEKAAGLVPTKKAKKGKKNG